MTGEEMTGDAKGSEAKGCGSEAKGCGIFAAEFLPW